jgi:hypothetical protein
MHFGLIYNGKTYQLQYPNLILDPNQVKPKPITPSDGEVPSKPRRPLAWEPVREETTHFFDFIFNDSKCHPLTLELQYADDKTVVPATAETEELNFARFVIWMAQYLNGQLYATGIDLRIMYVDQNSSEERENGGLATHRCRYPVPAEAFQLGAGRIKVTLPLQPYNPPRG